jgi:hypothetical protein
MSWILRSISRVGITLLVSMSPVNSAVGSTEFALDAVFVSKDGFGDTLGAVVLLLLGSSFWTLSLALAAGPLPSAEAAIMRSRELQY